MESHYFLKTSNSLIVLGSVLIGILLGEWWKIEEGLEKLAIWLEAKFNRGTQSDGKEKFIKGFLTATLVFCIGPMAILGSIENGLSGNINTLVVKSILDGFAAMAFASSLGVGVLFSAFIVLIYQGSISMLAAQVHNIATATMMNELTATGGVILVAIAISSLLEIKKDPHSKFITGVGNRTDYCIHHFIDKIKKVWRNSRPYHNPFYKLFYRCVKSGNQISTGYYCTVYRERRG